MASWIIRFFKDGRLPVLSAMLIFMKSDEELLQQETRFDGLIHCYHYNTRGQLERLVELGIEELADNSKVIFDKEDYTMKNQYHICDNIGNILFYFDDLIECHDFSGMGYCYLFALSGVSDKNIGHLLDSQFVTLESLSFNGRFSIEFLVKKSIKISDDLFYLYIEVLRQGMYEFGALSLLKVHGGDNSGRIWLDMKGDAKKIYFSQLLS